MGYLPHDGGQSANALWDCPMTVTDWSPRDYEGGDMPKYLITREVPGVQDLNAAELQALSAKSNDALVQLGGSAQWVQSYVTPDRLVCVYNAENEEKAREHARIGGFPCNEIKEVAGIIDPVTGEG
jgi:hypothetical protein